MIEPIFNFLVTIVLVAFMLALTLLILGIIYVLLKTLYYLYFPNKNP